MGRCDHNSRSEQPTWGIYLVAGLGSQTPPSDKMNMTVASRQRVQKINRRLLKQITTALLADLKIEKAELGIHLVAVQEITRLNEKFLHHKGSTDVITFDYTNEVAQASRLPRPSNRRQSSSRDGCATFHGEIFICVDEAVLQARKFGTSWQSEVIRYMVHGVLHLLGFDDSSAGARRKMKREENRLLREITRRFPLSKL
jgi:probable rRNA maturation factor